MWTGDIVVLNNYGFHGLPSYVSSLPILVLQNLELEAIKFYDKANKLYNTALLVLFSTFPLSLYRFWCQP